MTENLHRQSLSYLQQCFILQFIVDVHRHHLTHVTVVEICAEEASPGYSLSLAGVWVFIELTNANRARLC